MGRFRGSKVGPGEQNSHKTAGWNGTNDKMFIRDGNMLHMAPHVFVCGLFFNGRDIDSTEH